MPIEVPKGWQDRLLATIAGVVIGVVATHSNHGSRLDQMEQSLARLQRTVDSISDRLPVRKGE